FVERYTNVTGWDGWSALGLGVALALVLATRPPVQLGVAIVALAACFLLVRWHVGWLLLVLLLPTVIHVVVFTALFMLHGNLKSGSRWGHAALAAYVLCGAALLLYRPVTHHALGTHAKVLFQEFVPVIGVLGNASGASPPMSWPAFVAIGRFLGFAYTYHYLNWFSKTGIIRWHVMSRRRIALVGGLYVASVAVYGWDYQVGIIALFLLSLIHVLLELPLDLQTIGALGTRLVPSRLAGARALPASATR
ncbi:MAG TPA: hypothetical protein VKA21_14820, partial [Candidatus Binatia bacterium]|nr:hypothetical protein [Candidatus Binatia bacterium]